MRIPKLDNRSRAGLLGLGMFMVALSTVAEYTSTTQQDERWEVTHTAALNHEMNTTDTVECRDAAQNQAIARLQRL